MRFSRISVSFGAGLTTQSLATPHASATAARRVTDGDLGQYPHSPASFARPGIGVAEGSASNESKVTGSPRATTGFTR
jgi:hypothetical protein